jgi:ATP-dependent Clp protease ATP-binding subunit ClpA
MKRPKSERRDQELIAKFIAERGVTRCPTVVVVPTQGGVVSAEDMQLLRRIGDAADQAWSWKRGNRHLRQILSARAKAGAATPTPPRVIATAPMKTAAEKRPAAPKKAGVFALIEQELLKGGVTVDSIARAVAEQTGRPLAKVTKTTRTQLSRMRQTRGLRITTERKDGRAIYWATKINAG